MATRFIVQGRVQGVGFRMFVLRNAQDRNWKGEVWNRRDGGVELVVANAEEGDVRALLERGPGRVDAVIVESAPEPNFEGFSVGPTR